jgi:hypothetical protein
VNNIYVNCMKHRKDFFLFYNSLHSTPMSPLNMNSTMEEADQNKSHP